MSSGIGIRAQRDYRLRLSGAGVEVRTGPRRHSWGLRDGRRRCDTWHPPADSVPRGECGHCLGEEGRTHLDAGIYRPGILTHRRGWQNPLETGGSAIRPTSILKLRKVSGCAWVFVVGAVFQYAAQSLAGVPL